MPFMILYGGELVFLFVGARIAAWMWRSREQVRALWRDRHAVPSGGPSFDPDPLAAPHRLRTARVIPFASRAAPRGGSLRRAA
jgi:hypothetical protein